jgi:hypothetical protein
MTCSCREALERIADGNFGPDPWQAGWGEAMEIFFERNVKR